MNPQEEIKHLRDSLKQAENIQAELDLRVFNLKTLYDVSNDLYSSVESETIIRNFLLMAMGNFGVAEGFILLLDPQSKTPNQFVSIGFQNDDMELLENAGIQILKKENLTQSSSQHPGGDHRKFIFPAVEFSLPFAVSPDCPGLLGLGSKLIGEPFNNNDIELLDTLVNNLVVALKNARSFEQIRKLNKSLHYFSIKSLDIFRFNNFIF